MAFFEYTEAAQKAMGVDDMGSHGKDAKNVITNMDDGQVEEWSKTVEEKALSANTVFLKQLNTKGIKSDEDASFVTATLLSTSLITYRRVNFFPRSWLFQFHHGLAEIISAAKISSLQAMLLSPVEICQHKMDTFVELTALASITNIVALVERTGQIDAEELLRTTRSLLRELMCYCELYFEDTPRPETQ